MYAKTAGIIVQYIYQCGITWNELVICLRATHVQDCRRENPYVGIEQMVVACQCRHFGHNYAVKLLSFIDLVSLLFITGT